MLTKFTNNCIRKYFFLCTFFIFWSVMLSVHAFRVGSFHTPSSHYHPPIPSIHPLHSCIHSLHSSAPSLYSICSIHPIHTSSPSIRPIHPLHPPAPSIVAILSFCQNCSKSAGYLTFFYSPNPSTILSVLYAVVMNKMLLFFYFVA